MKDPLYMQYADYYQMYLDSMEDCTQETFEACNWVNELADGASKWVFSVNPIYSLNPIYMRKISAESAIA